MRFRWSHGRIFHPIPLTDDGNWRLLRYLRWPVGAQAAFCRSCKTKTFSSVQTVVIQSWSLLRICFAQAHRSARFAADKNVRFALGWYSMPPSLAALITLCVLKGSLSFRRTWAAEGTYSPSAGAFNSATTLVTTAGKVAVRGRPLLDLLGESKPDVPFQMSNADPTVEGRTFFNHEAINTREGCCYFRRASVPAAVVLRERSI